MTSDEDRIRATAEAYKDAWNSGSPEAVAAFFAADGKISINGGDPWHGRNGIAQMAANFFSDVPNLSLTCDDVRMSDRHVAFLWTFTGTNASSGNAMEVSGWEEWDLDGTGLIAESRGWFDANNYDRQATSEG